MVRCYLPAGCHRVFNHRVDRVERSGFESIVEIVMKMSTSPSGRGSIALLLKSFASLSAALCFLTAFEPSALAKSDDHAWPDTKTAVSKLSVSSKTLSYLVDFDKGESTETRRFTIKNEGALALQVTVDPPSNGDYVITSGGGQTTIPGKIKGSNNSLTVDVEFTPHGPGKNIEGSIQITSNGTSGKSSANVNLQGSATQKKSTPITVTLTRYPTIPVNLPILPAPAGDPLGAPVAATAVFDFDGDGINDVVLAPSYFNSKPDLPMIWLKGSAKGFTDVTASLFPAGAPLTEFVRTPIVADFNGDRILDYFGADTGQEIPDSSNQDGYVNSTNRLMLSSGTGSFQDATDRLPSLTAFNHGACAADIDGSGRISIVVTPLGESKSYLILNTPSGFVFDQTHLPRELTQYPAPPTLNFSPSSCALSDINGDKSPDLIASAYDQNVTYPQALGTRIFLNVGTGTFMPSSTTLPPPPGTPNWGSTSIYVRDFDGNGLPDILIAYESNCGSVGTCAVDPTEHYALELWLQTSSGVFQDATVAAFGGYGTDVGPWRELSVDDFNGDGAPDIFLRFWGTPSPNLADNVRQRILINDGKGHFSPPAEPFTFSSPPSPYVYFMTFDSASHGILTLLGFEDTFGSSDTISGVTLIRLNIPLGEPQRSK